MTLGLGTLCNKGETMVIGSEQRASYGVTGNIAIDPNDEAGKVFRLAPRIFVSVAGSLSVCQEVYAQFAHLYDNLQNKDVIPSERMAWLLNEARFHRLKHIYDWQLKRKMGIGLTQWAQGKIRRGMRMHRLIVEYGHEILENTPFKCELIVAGFHGEHGFFLRASQKEHVQEETSPGVYAIGCGQVAAMRHLNKRGQNVYMTLPRTLLHVYEALYISQSQYVGPPPEFLIVVWKRNNLVAVYPTELLEPWRKLYETRPSTVSLDESGTAQKEVLARLKQLQETPQSHYPTPPSISQTSKPEK